MEDQEIAALVRHWRGLLHLKRMIEDLRGGSTGAAVMKDILARRWQAYNTKIWDIKYKLELVVW